MINQVITRLSLLFFVILFNFLNISYSQVKVNQTFLAGYYGGVDIDSVYKNFIFVTKSDTGLVFSPKVYSEYELGLTQASTHCDAFGNPLLQWQGCYLLDAKTMKPINNGEFNKGPGTVATDTWPDPFCGKYIFEGDPGPGTFKPYFAPWSTFILDRDDISNLLLVYYRTYNMPLGNINYMHFAGINMKNGPDQKPTVIFKDSLAVGTINLKYGTINAIRHGNGKDWWITFSESNTYNWYAMLWDGISLHNPIKSTVLEIDGFEMPEGMTATSPDGTKIAIHHANGFGILNFDRCSGKISYNSRGKVPEENHSTPFRFVEFSPNNRFVYLSTILNIYQFDLLDPDFDQSRSLVATFDESIPVDNPYPGYFSTPFRGFDGKLYYWCFNTAKRVHRMAFPDQKGPDVGFTQYFYKLPIYPSQFTPTFIDYNTPALPEPCELNSNQLTEIQIKFTPNPTNGYIKAVFNDAYNYNIASIIDLNGRILWKGESRLLKDGINVEEYSGGIYHVFFDGKFAGRFVKI